MFGSDQLFAMIGMGFALIMTVVIGGFVLLFPTARRLGQAVEEWVRLRKRESAGEIPAEDAAHLVRAVESLQGEVQRLVARQEFVESLLERERESPRLPTASE